MKSGALGAERPSSEGPSERRGEERRGGGPREGKTSGRRDPGREPRGPELRAGPEAPSLSPESRAALTWMLRTPHILGPALRRRVAKGGQRRGFPASLRRRRGRLWCRDRDRDRVRSRGHPEPPDPLSRSPSPQTRSRGSSCPFKGVGTRVGSRAARCSLGFVGRSGIRVRWASGWRSARRDL